LLGIHLEKEPNRLQRLYVEDQRLWDIVVNKWVSGKVKQVLEMFNIKYGGDLKNNIVSQNNTQANSTSLSLNKDLTVTQQVATPKSATQTSLNPDNYMFVRLWLTNCGLSQITILPCGNGG